MYVKKIFILIQFGCGYASYIGSFLYEKGHNKTNENNFISSFK